jgi:hypothetical protein
MTVSFACYSQEGKTYRGLSLEQLLEIAKDGSILARAEDSGCEGCYIEVARWKQGKDCHSGNWYRFAFEKVFGGEDMTLEEQDAAHDRSDRALLSSHATAERIAAKINEVSGNARVALIHRFPTWEDA